MIPPPLPHTWRPFGVRMASFVFGGGLAVISAVAWFGMPPEIRAAFTEFQRLTLVGMALCAAAALHALVRCRVTATEKGLTVINGYRRRELEWAEVVAVRLPPGAPWATFDLSDGSAISAIGIQGSDGDRAQRAIAELRALISR